MTNTHEQAMHSIYRQVLERLLEHMTQGQRAALQLLIQRLVVSAGGIEYVGQFQLVVVHGTDRDSALLLACLRAAQLSIAQRAPATFRLRVLVTSLPASSADSLKFHERCFSTLFLQDDPRVELLMIEGHGVVPFNSRPVVSVRAWARPRESLLLFGHLNGGRPDALFGSRLHLQLAQAVAQSLACHDGALALLTLIPERQRRRYLAWCRRCLRLAGEPGLNASAVDIARLAEAIARLQSVAAAPFDASDGAPRQANGHSAFRVIAVDDLIRHEGPSEQLERMLNTRFADAVSEAPLAAYFEVDALAQLQHVRARMLLRRRQDKRQPLGLNRHGAGPLALVSEHGRARVLPVLHLHQQQLICLLYAPFADYGRRLLGFVACFHPRMLAALPYLHRALRGDACPEGVKQWLREVSGLSLAQLKAVYARKVGQPAMRLLANLAKRDRALRLLEKPLQRSEKSP